MVQAQGEGLLMVQAQGGGATDGPGTRGRGNRWSRYKGEGQ